MVPFGQACHCGPPALFGIAKGNYTTSLLKPLTPIAQIMHHEKNKTKIRKPK